MRHVVRAGDHDTICGSGKGTVQQAGAQYIVLNHERLIVDQADVRDLKMNRVLAFFSP